MRALSPLLAAAVIPLVTSILATPAAARSVEVSVELPERGHDMVYDDARGRLYVSVPLLDEIVVISTLSYEIVDRVSIPWGPQALELSIDGRSLFIGLGKKGAIVRLDLDTMSAREINVGSVIGASDVHDVIEVSPDRVFVSSFTSSARIGEIRLDLSDRVSVVASDRRIDSRPRFAVSTDSRFLYIGQESGTFGSLYKLDLAFSSAPIVLERFSSSLSGLWDLELSPDGVQIYTASGRVQHTASFNQIGQIGFGLHRFGSSGDVVYSANLSFDLVDVYNPTSFQKTGEFAVNCAFMGSNRVAFEVLPGDRGWLVMSGDEICGLIAEPACALSPPEPQSPGPLTGETSVRFGRDLTWRVDSPDCPGTFNVFLDTSNPPTTLICKDVSRSRCDTGRLEPGSTYYWQVEAVNALGVTPGPVWSFTTAAFDPATYRPLSIPLGGIGSDMVVDDGGQRVYLSVPSLDELLVISLADARIEERIAVGASPRGLDLSHDGRHLYIAQSEAGTVRLLDLATNAAVDVMVSDVPSRGELIDVLEARPNGLIAVTNLNGRYGMGMIRLDEGNQIRYIGDSRISSGATIFAADDNEQSLYAMRTVGTPNGVLKYDLTRDEVPFMREDSRVDDASHIALSPDGTRLYVRSGEVLRTGSMLETYRIPAGIHAVDDSGDAVYTTVSGNQIEVHDTTSLEQLMAIDMPCDYQTPVQQIVLPGGKGWLVLADDVLCGLVFDPTCAVPPAAPAEPAPSDGFAGVGLNADLTWGAEDVKCSTTYDVLFGEESPPTTMLCRGIDYLACDPGILEPAKTYYWQVISRSGAGETAGPVWSFTTGPFAALDLHDVAVDLGGDGFDAELDIVRGMIYVSVPSRNEIVSISLRSMTVERRFVVGAHPHGIDLSDDGRLLYVALNWAGSVVIVDLDTWEAREIVVSHVVGDSALYDVIEGRPGWLFVSADPMLGAKAAIAMIDLAAGGVVSSVAEGREIDERPFLARSPDRRFLFVASERLYRLDLDQPGAPVNLSAGLPGFPGKRRIEIAPGGSLLFVADGRVYRSGSFTQIGTTKAGIHRFGDHPGIVNVASVPNEIEMFNANSLEKTGKIVLSCSFASIEQLLVLPGGSGWLVLGGDKVCGRLIGAGCPAPPLLPDTPFPADGETGIGRERILGWSSRGEKCPTRFDVLLDTVNPPRSVHCGGLRETACPTGELSPETTYYWQVIAANGVGEQAGPIWSFTTGRAADRAHLALELDFGTPAFDMVLDPARQRIYVSLPETNEIAMVSTLTFAITGRVPIGPSPQGLDISRDGGSLIAALGKAGSVALLDLETLERTEIVVGDLLDGSRVYDVVEGKPGRIVVTVDSRSFDAAAGMIMRDQGDRVVRIANDAPISFSPVLAASSDQRWVYAGDQLSSNHVYKLDLDQEGVPIALKNESGAAFGTTHFELSPDDVTLYLASGMVLDTDTLRQIGRVGSGVHDFNDSGDTVYAFERTGLIEAYDPRSFIKVGEFRLPCALEQVRQLIVLPMESGWLALGDDHLCGLVDASLCRVAPVPDFTPQPADGDPEVPLSADLVWGDGGDGCPRTYDVLFGTESPPTSAICTGLRESRCTPGALAPGTTYHWQVIATNAAGTAAGPVYSFTTTTTPPPLFESVSLDLGGAGSDMAYDERREVLYVLVPSLREAIAISTRDFEIVDRLSLGSGYRNVALSGEGELLLAGASVGAVLVLDPVSRQATAIPVTGVTGGSGTFDLTQGRPNRLFVSADPGAGFSSLGMIRRDQNNSVVRVATGWSFHGDQHLVPSPDQRSLFIASIPSGTASEKDLYKIDVSQEAAPLVKQLRHATFGSSAPPAISRDGAMLFLPGGEAYRTASFILAGVTTPGIHAVGEDGVVYLARPPGTIETWKTPLFGKLGELTLDCRLENIKGLVALSGGRGWMVLGDRQVCGLFSDPDGDGLPNEVDNCRRVANPDQVDSDVDAVGDVCDNCPGQASSDQADRDGDSLGDVCDPYPDHHLTGIIRSPDRMLTDRANAVEVQLRDESGGVLRELRGVRVTLRAGGAATFGEQAIAGDIVSGGGTGAVLVEFVDGSVVLDLISSAPGRVVLSGDDTEGNGIRISADRLEDFESGAGGFTHSGPGDSWDHGSPASGPGAAYSGERAWATNLDGPYENLSDSALRSSSFLVGDGPAPRIELRSWTRIEACCGDRGLIRIVVDDSQDSELLDTLTGISNGYELLSYDLSRYVNARISVEFRLQSGPGGVDAGWYIDDFAIRNTVQPIEFLSGSEDADGDGLSNREEFERGSDPTNPDTDRDLVGDSMDNCPLISNSVQSDIAHPDGIGDACDDPDLDGVFDEVDNCIDTPNPEQADRVHVNGIGDACEDPDEDGAYDNEDNCPDDINPDQSDADEDDTGNACDICPMVPNPQQNEEVACIEILEDGGQCLEARIELVAEQGEGEIVILRSESVAPESIVFEFLATSCGDSDPFEMSLNGVRLGSVALDPLLRCTCALPVQSFRIDDPLLLAGIWRIGGENVLSLGKGGTRSAFAWARARFEAGSISETACMLDIGGGNCSTGNLCNAGPSFASFEHESTVVIELVGEVIVNRAPYVASQLPALIDIKGLEPGAGLLCADVDPVLVGSRSCVSFVKGTEEDVAINGAPCGPPVADSGADQVVECASAAGALVTLAGSGSGDPNSTPGTIDDIASFAWYEDFGLSSERLIGTEIEVLVPFTLGLHNVTLRVSDSFGEVDTDEVSVRVVDTAGPVLEGCSEPLRSECTGPEGAAMNVIVSASDECGGPVVIDNDRTSGGADASGVYPLGLTAVTFSAKDESGNVSECVAAVGVVDTTPPSLSVAADPSMLWPPNHRMVDVRMSWDSRDVCGPVEIKLESLSSDEPDDAEGDGDGRTTGDFLVVGDDLLRLRAERAAGGSGRVYTIVYTAVDSSGNAASSAVWIRVPHDQTGGTDPVHVVLEEHGSGTRVSWGPVSGAAFYNVIRGNVGHIRDTGDMIDLGPVVCVEKGLTDTSTLRQEDPDTPTLGDAFFYLVEYFDGTSSSYGSERAGKASMPGPGFCQ